MENLTINLKPVGFRSPFQHEGEVYSVEGEFRTNSEKKLTNISGTIKKNESFKGSFNGDGMPDSEGLNFSFSSIRDPREAGAIANTVADALDSITAKLNQE